MLAVKRPLPPRFVCPVMAFARSRCRDPGRREIGTRHSDGPVTGTALGTDREPVAVRGEPPVLSGAPPVAFRGVAALRRAVVAVTGKVPVRERAVFGIRGGRDAGHAGVSSRARMEADRAVASSPGCRSASRAMSPSREANSAVTVTLVATAAAWLSAENSAAKPATMFAASVLALQ